jgi:hypothetical protein
MCQLPNSETIEAAEREERQQRRAERGGANNGRGVGPHGQPLYKHHVKINGRIWEERVQPVRLRNYLLPAVLIAMIFLAADGVAVSHSNTPASLDEDERLAWAYWTGWLSHALGLLVYMIAAIRTAVVRSPFDRYAVVLLQWAWGFLVYGVAAHVSTLQSGDLHSILQDAILTTWQLHAFGGACLFLFINVVTWQGVQRRIKLIPLEEPKSLESKRPMPMRAPRPQRIMMPPAKERGGGSDGSDGRDVGVSTLASVNY